MFNFLFLRVLHMDIVWPAGGAALPDFKSLHMLLTLAIEVWVWLSRF